MGDPSNPDEVPGRPPTVMSPEEAQAVWGAAAHEMNNPLAALSFRLELFEADPALTGAQRVSVERLASQVQRLAVSVHSLQVLSGVPLQPSEPLDVAAFCEAELPSLLPLLRGVNLRLKVQDDVGAVEAPVEHLRQVWTGMLLELSRRLVAQDELRTELEATSSGVRLSVHGVPQGSEGPRRVDALSLSGRAAEWMATQLGWGWSDTGGAVGTRCLFVTLPRDVTERHLPEEAKVAEPADLSEAPSSLIVLIIEDEPGFAKVLEMLLRGRGHTCQRFETAEGAQAALEAGLAVDVVLCDQRLPGSDGLSLLQWLNERRHCLADRFVLMSGFPCPSGHEGPFLSKPFSPQVLLRALGQVASRD